MRRARRGSATATVTFERWRPTATPDGVPGVARFCPPGRAATPHDHPAVGPHGACEGARARADCGPTSI